MPVQGHFDCIRGRAVCGWAWDPSKPDERITVRVLFNGEPIANGPAATHRPDLEAAGIGSGQHAFFISLPDSHLDGREGELTVQGSDGAALAGTPTRLTLPDLRFRPLEPLDTPPPITLSVCAIVKDEGPYLLEWLAHHRLVGVQHFVIFDNGSTDGTGSLLAGLARAGILDYVPWPNIPGVAAQRPAYIAGLARLAERSRWVAFIDADEFLNPLRGETVPDILKDYETAAGLMVPWRLYGSNGHQDQTDDLVVRRFTRRARPQDSRNNLVKTIVQARTVLRPDIHTVQVSQGSLVDEFWQLGGSQGHPDNHAVPAAERLVLNHYFTKSRAEWQHKRSRGRATEQVGSAAWRRPDDHFTAHDVNDIEDTGLASHAMAIQQEMDRLGALLRENH